VIIDKATALEWMLYDSGVTTALVPTRMVPWTGQMPWITVSL
jgi:hypothetical protein